MDYLKYFKQFEHTEIIRRPFMSGTYQDEHFVAKLEGDKYILMPEYSNGKDDDYTFFANDPDAKFSATIEEAQKK